MSEDRRGFSALIHRLHDQFYARFLIAMVIGGLLLGLNVLFVEHQPAYGALRLWAYGKIQRSLKPDPNLEEPTVQLVDISEMPTESGPNVAPGGAAVDRKALLAMIERIVAGKPNAIGVDVDFSPDENGNPITLEDEEFFFACEKLSRRSSVPIYLGVHRHAAGTAAGWLGDAGSESLAAGLGVGNKEFQAEAAELKTEVPSVLRMLSWTRSREDGPILKSLAFALAENYIDVRDEPPSWLKWALEIRSEFNPDESLHTEGFLVSYRLLDEMDHNAITADQLKTTTPIAFNKRFVILGDINRKGTGKAGEDVYRVPGREGWFSGVLLHGSAVDTLVYSPLRQWTHLGRIALDIFLVIVGFLLIEAARFGIFTRRGLEMGKPVVEWMVTAVMAVVVLSISLLLADSLKLIWDDAVFVALSMFIHTGVERIITPKHHHESPALTEEPTSEEEVDPT